MVASLGANVATAGLLDLADVPDWLRILVAGWPALAFLGGTLLVHTPAVPAPKDHSTQSTAVQAVIEPSDSYEPDASPAAAPAPAPALPAVDPEPEPVPAAVAVPPALVAHARKVADDHRARTGHPIDTDTLRARLGVPPPMADAIAAQLA